MSGNSQPADLAAVPPTAVLTAVGQLAVAAEQAALVRLGLSTGLLARCREWVAVSELATATGASAATATALCTALVSLGALRRDGGRVRLSGDWMPLVSDGLDVALRQALDGTAARQRMIEEALAEPATYWELAAAQRQALAESVTLATTTAFGRAAAAGLVAEIGGMEEELRAARYLELGCGVAGFLLGAVQHYPDLQAVAVDIAPDLLAVARARARELGVSDRIEFVECDARDYADAEPFDIVFWAQYFFPADSREATLKNAFARLRPGGQLACPVLPVDPEAREAGSPEAQRAALTMLVLSGSGVPARSGAQLAREVADAGFTDIRVVGASLATILLARRP